jgi:hypothetical protein
VGVRTCLHSLMIISSSNSCVSCSCLLDSIEFHRVLHVFYPTWSSVNKQDAQTRKITIKACKTRIGNQSILNGCKVQMARGG